MRVYKTQKQVFCISKGASKFLDGLTSNKLDQPHNAFLTIHGRIVVTFDQLRIGEDEFVIAVESKYTDQLLAHVDRYVKLSGVKFEKLDHSVYFDLDNTVSVNDGGWVIEQKQGRLIITEEKLEENISDEEFTLFRLQHNIPQHGIDYTDEMLLNVSTKEFVSFTKGCFLGQEPISKVYNRSKPTWRLEVRSEGDCSDEETQKMTSKVKDPRTAKVLGFVFVSNN